MSNASVGFGALWLALARHRAVVAEHFHVIDQVTMRSASSQVSRVGPPLRLEAAAASRVRMRPRTMNNDPR